MMVILLVVALTPFYIVALVASWKATVTLLGRGKELEES